MTGTENGPHFIRICESAQISSRKFKILTKFDAAAFFNSSEKAIIHRGGPFHGDSLLRHQGPDRVTGAPDRVGAKTTAQEPGGTVGILRRPVFRLGEKPFQR